MSQNPIASQAFSQLTSTQRLTLSGLLVLIAVAGLSAAVGGVFSPPSAEGGSDALYTGSVTTMTPYTGTADVVELKQLRDLLDIVGESELTTIELDRSKALLEFSTRFRVPLGLATLVHDAALREGLDPELAFRLVRAESGFRPGARSRAAAYGLAQVQLATARHYEPNLTIEQLLHPERNLRIGFRYLQDLRLRYEGDMRLALLAYNVGPSRLQEILDGGRNPRDAYALRVLEGHGIKPRSELPR